MGIDVYMRWTGQTEAERQSQYTGYSVVAGHVGYLREGGGGSPSAIKALLPEAWSNNGEDTPTSATKMRERLPAAKAAIEQRYGHEREHDPDIVDDVCVSFENFVALAERKEADGLTVSVAVR